MVPINEAMTAYELSYLISETEAFVDVIFSRWVQATFAVLVATYFAAERINTLFLKIMGLLYFAYSLAQLSTIAFQASKLVDYVYALEKLVDDYAGNVIFSVPGAVLILVVFIVGTVSTLYFLHHTQKKGASSGAP
jgi:hypothetical protein